MGFIDLLTRELWVGHPCCAFGISSAFVQENPSTYAALYRAVLEAATVARDPKNRAQIAQAIAPANYLNQPVPVIEQVLSGRYADGLGNVKNVPERIDFDPVPWYSMAVWIMTQMKRWGYVNGNVQYKDIAEKVFLLIDVKKRMAETGISRHLSRSRAADQDYPGPGGAGVTVFANIQFGIEKGDLVCIIGHSGCGKSTILNIVAGLEEQSTGNVFIAGREVKFRGLIAVPSSRARR